VTPEQTRVDISQTFREEVALLDLGGREMFACAHLPNRSPIGGLVICCPLHAEFQTNYRREVLLARQLAGRGVAVQRFHYRGTGNSGGELEDATFSSMKEDAVSAARHLRASAGIERISFLGTRWGALVAAAASENGNAPLVLWEPVTSSDRYFREVFRAATIRDLREGTSAHPAGELLRKLNAEGTVDVLGYSVHRNLYDSAQQSTLEEELGTTPRDVLLVQLSRTSELRAPYRRLVESLQRNQVPVEVEAIQANEAWWFSNDPSRSRSVTEAVIRSTVSWLIARLDPQMEPAGA
jgi:alpha/beta superfamily hydrolase